MKGGGWLAVIEVSKQTLRWNQPPNPSHTSRTGKCSNRELDLESGMPAPPPASIHNHGLTCMHIARIASPVPVQLRVAVLDRRMRSRWVTRPYNGQRKRDRPIGYFHVKDVCVSKMTPKVVDDPIEPSSSHVIMSDVTTPSAMGQHHTQAIRYTYMVVQLLLPFRHSRIRGGSRQCSLHRQPRRRQTQPTSCQVRLQVCAAMGFLPNQPPFFLSD